MDRQMRKKLNQKQKEAYNAALHAATLGRYDGLQAPEIKVMNLARVIIEGGWIITPQVMQQIIEMAGVVEI